MAELTTTLAVIDKSLAGVQGNLTALQVEIKELRREQSSLTDRLSHLEGSLAGVEDKVRLEFKNLLLEARLNYQETHPPKKLPPSKQRS
jgi:predicted  nucleic acid-binding Zn-ribbon protein